MVYNLPMMDSFIYQLLSSVYELAPKVPVLATFLIRAKNWVIKLHRGRFKMEPNGNINPRIWHGLGLLSERMYKVARTGVLFPFMTSW